MSDTEKLAAGQTETPEDRGDDFAPTEENMEVVTSVDAGEVTEPPVEAPAEASEASKDEEASQAAEPPEDPPEAPEKPSKRKMIPKERFDEVNTRMQRAESELKSLQEQREKLVGQELAAFDFDGAEQKYADAIVSGKLDEAKQLRAEMRVAERQQAQRLATEQAVMTYESVAAKAAIDAAASFINLEYPVYDPKSEVYDQKIVDEALDLFNGLMSTGKHTPGEALVRAAKATAAMKGLVAEGVAPSEPVAKAKAKATLEGKLKAAAQQPPNVTTSRKAAQSINVEKLSDKEFSKLDETTLRKLRGDYL